MAKDEKRQRNFKGKDRNQVFNMQKYLSRFQKRDNPNYDKHSENNSR